MEIRTEYSSRNQCTTYGIVYSKRTGVPAMVRDHMDGDCTGIGGMDHHNNNSDKDTERGVVCYSEYVTYVRNR